MNSYYMTMPHHKLKVYLRGGCEVTYKNRKLKISPASECWVVYQVFSTLDKAQLAQYFKSLCSDFIVHDMDTIDKLIADIRKLYKVEMDSSMKPLDIVQYASPGGIWEMYSPVHKKLYIPWEFENRVISGLKNMTITSTAQVAREFARYREDVGINARYIKDRNTQDSLLATMFLEQHGVNMWWLQHNYPHDPKKDWPVPGQFKYLDQSKPLSPFMKELRSAGVGVLLGLAWIVPPLLLLELANFVASFSSFPCTILAMVIGMLAIGWLALPFKL